jgi:hypothetical protein
MEIINENYWLDDGRRKLTPAQLNLFGPNDAYIIVTTKKGNNNKARANENFQAGVVSIKEFIAALPPSPPLPPSVANVGTGQGTIYRDSAGNIVNLKTIKKGPGVTITNNANEIIIESEVYLEERCGEIFIVGQVGGNRYAAKAALYPDMTGPFIPAVCLAGLVVNIQPGGFTNPILATDLVQSPGSGGVPPLIYTISKDNVNFFPSLTFDCSELGNNTVYLRTEDSFNCIAYCQTFIEIQDPMVNCP